MKFVKVWNDIEDMIEEMKGGAVEEVSERESLRKRRECLSERMESSQLGLPTSLICEYELEDAVEIAA
jgi:hypothetical protein